MWFLYSKFFDRKKVTVNTKKKLDAKEQVIYDAFCVWYSHNKSFTSGYFELCTVKNAQLRVSDS